ncbi:efflux RND transporter periplasmic adaptor subunit [Vibrio profundum]|uniref:efflux RND transporter periplasmic adaptor subunit n=1 Tax=Vibrio profundum TaxID=2910247 RepID=UPI003D0C8579
MPISHFARKLSSRPWLVSILIVFALAIWLSLGEVNSQQAPSPPPASVVPLAKVAYQTFHSQPTQNSVELYGRTAPDKHANIAAQYAGQIVSLAVRKGDAVQDKQLLAKIDTGDLSIQLAQAKAMRKVKEQEFRAAKSLKKRGLQGEVAFFTAEAELVQAKANVQNALKNLSNTKVTAAFNGIVDNLHIELGDYVSVGDPIAHLIDIEKLVIEADVSERQVQALKVGQVAKLLFVDGRRAEGSVRYVAKVASPATNTFPVEVEVDNPKQAIPAGVSVEVALVLPAIPAIKITPAMLALDEAGNLGVKTLQGSRVQFVPIQLVKASQDGVWLSGLGENVQIITVGQGFVRDGDEVTAIEDQGSAGKSAK